MLRRKPTRIELKPDDREEYFQHKNKAPDTKKDEKDKEKEIRLGISKPR